MYTVHTSDMNTYKQTHVCTHTHSHIRALFLFPTHTHQPRSPCRVSHCEAHTQQSNPQSGAWSGEKLTPAKNDQNKYLHIKKGTRVLGTSTGWDNVLRLQYLTIDLKGSGTLGYQL